MKTTLLTTVCMATLLVGSVACSNQHEVAVTTDVPQYSQQDKLHYDSLVLRARTGDDGAYLALSEFYHDGRVVERSYVNTLIMQWIYCSRTGTELETVVQSYSDDDPYRVLMEVLMHKSYADINTRQLAFIEKHLPAEAKVIDLGRQFEEERDTVRFLQALREVEHEGSELNPILQIIWANESGDDAACEACLTRVANRFPLLYCAIGRKYVNCYHTTGDFTYIERGIECYYKADAHAMMLSYCAGGLYDTYDHFMKKGLLTCSNEEMERLHVLSGRQGDW